MFGILLDSGVEMLARHYATREEARTALAREQKARGDLVSLRLAVGIVEHKLEAERAALASGSPLKPPSVRGK
jgi:hypothetical protein